MKPLKIIRDEYLEILPAPPAHHETEKFRWSRFPHNAPSRKQKGVPFSPVLGCQEYVDNSDGKYKIML
jgi:hypothetical protein